MNNRSWARMMVGALAAVASVSQAGAQDTIPRWEISGQVRPRFEYRNGYRTLLPPSVDGVVFFSQRTRLGVLYKGEAKARAFLQVQDVRTWGDETHTSSDATADKFDLHQGYVDLLPNQHWTLRIGRQEISYDEERLLGVGNWNQAGRAHDAVRVMWRSGKTEVHAAWAHHEMGEPLAWSTYKNPSNYQDLAFLWAGYVNAREQLSGLLIFDSYDPSYTHAGYPNRWTAGIYSKLTVPVLELRGEAYYQTGKYELRDMNFNQYQVDVRAYMFGLSATRRIGPTAVTLWYDYLSGDRALYDDRFESFDPLYGTFHKFYGWMDYFTNFPDDTRGLGLQDVALKFAYSGPKSISAQADLHYFRLAQTSTYMFIYTRNLGFEGDLAVSIPLLKMLTISAGASLFIPTDETALDILKHPGDEGHWVWTMLDFNVK